MVLTNDVLLEIVQHLDTESYGRFAQVNKQFNCVAQSYNLTSVVGRYKRLWAKKQFKQIALINDDLIHHRLINDYKQIDSINKLIENNLINIFNYLIKYHYHFIAHELKCTKRTMDFAAKNGHLYIVQWLHENRSEGCTEYAINFAANNGHLHMVQWLRENISLFQK